MKGTEMKGIERLLDWVGTLRLSGLVWADEMADELESTVDLIKREHAEDCCKMGLDYGAVSRVVTDMERHLLGHEGMEDSPVARWARELREALGGDAEADEDREAAAWVRDHGGLDEVRRRWKYLSHYADPVPRSCMERRLARLQRQIDESHAALRRRNQRIAVLASEINRAHNENRMEFMRRAGNYTAFFDEVCKRLAPQLRYVEGCSKDVMDAALDALDRRLMPEGMEWPRYEDGGPVRIGGAIADELGYEHVVTSVELHDDGADLHWNPAEPEECVWVGHGEPVKRPAVLAADGEPLEVGQTVWDTDAESDTPLTVVEVSSDLIWCEYTWKDGKTYRPCYPPSVLTHTKPERQNARFGPRTVAALHREIAGGDSWERIEEDKGLNPFDYCKKVGHKLWTFDNAEEVKASDLVRRCKALAERERGE